MVIIYGVYLFFVWYWVLFNRLYFFIRFDIRLWDRNCYIDGEIEVYLFIFLMRKCLR